MIDMHAHWRPAELADALRARTREPRIVRNDDGVEVLKTPGRRGAALQGVRRRGDLPRPDGPPGREHERAVAARHVLLDRVPAARGVRPAVPARQRQPVEDLPEARGPLRRLRRAAARGHVRRRRRARARAGAAGHRRRAAAGQRFPHAQGRREDASAARGREPAPRVPLHPPRPAAGRRLSRR